MHLKAGFSYCENTSLNMCANTMMLHFRARVEQSIREVLGRTDDIFFTSVYRIKDIGYVI